MEDASTRTVGPSIFTFFTGVVRSVSSSPGFFLGLRGLWLFDLRVEDLAGRVGQEGVHPLAELRPKGGIDVPFLDQLDRQTQLFLLILCERQTVQRRDRGVTGPTLPR